jgi:hypothetical protein
VQQINEPLNRSKTETVEGDWLISISGPVPSYLMIRLIDWQRTLCLVVNWTVGTKALSKSGRTGCIADFVGLHCLIHRKASVCFVQFADFVATLFDDQFATLFVSKCR